MGSNYTCKCVKSWYGQNCQYKQLNSTIFKNSTILTKEQSNKLVNLIGLNQTFKLIYQASRDGFRASNFHSKCDNALNSLVVIKSNNYVFGGYTEASWSGIGYKYDTNAFLFSLVNSYNTSLKMHTTNPTYAIYASPSNIVTFGGGYDFYCSDSGNCYSYGLGWSYQLPSFLTVYGTAASFLSGSSNFQATEIEVYTRFVNGKIFFLYFYQIYN